MTDPLNLTCSKENTFHTSQTNQNQREMYSMTMKISKRKQYNILCVYVCTYLIQ